VKIVSALFFTTCSISSGSTTGTDRMASMSLISERPRISSLVPWVMVMGSTPGVVRERGKDEGADEVARRLGVSEVDMVGRGEEVADDETAEQFDEACRLASGKVVVR
jgi:hypothetical protein